jgi:hypothetical protein
VVEATPTVSVVHSPPSSCRAKRNLSRRSRRASSRFA